MSKLLAEVNISEARDESVIEKLTKILVEDNTLEVIDINSDKDHNRTVFTYIGESKDILKGTKTLTKQAISLIDMTVHTGSHPRMGAVDVVPFIPVGKTTAEEAINTAKEFGKFLGSLGVPVFYYEDCATMPERKNLVDIRRGQYEALENKMKLPEWKPDEGPHKFVAKSGATVVGVRFPLVAFNVNLNTNNIDIGKQIVKSIRAATGGYKNVRAIALPIKEKDFVQISMNLINYIETPIHRVFETIKNEALSYGVTVAESELVGPVPLDALEDVLKHYLQVHSISMEQIYS